ncbi:MAG: CBS domain-containing protein [Thermoplasmata archaeon]
MKERLKVGDLEITDEYKVLGDKASIREVADELLKLKRGIVIVLDKSNEPIGVIYPQLILQRIANGEDLTKMNAKEIVDKNILILNKSDDFEKRTGDITLYTPAAILVNDKDGKLVGYLSPSDYKKAMKMISK